MREKLLGFIIGFIITYLVIGTFFQFLILNKHFASNEMEKHLMEWLKKRYRPIMIRWLEGVLNRDYYEEWKTAYDREQEQQAKLNTYIKILSENPNVSSEVRNIESRVRNGELSYDQAITMLEQIGDAYLGRGKTRRIVEITEKHNKGDISDENFVKEILEEVPTGLPKGLDNFVRKTAGNIAERILGE